MAFQFSVAARNAAGTLPRIPGPGAGARGMPVAAQPRARAWQAAATSNSDAPPPQPLDAAIVFAPVGELVPRAAVVNPVELDVQRVAEATKGVADDGDVLGSGPAQLALHVAQLAHEVEPLADAHVVQELALHPLAEGVAGQLVARITDVVPQLQ